MSCCRRRRRGISWCCGSRSWTAVLLLLLLLLVDVVVVVVIADLSEKPGAVYPEAVAYGAQKLKFRVCSGIIARDACLDAGVILKISLFLWSTYSNAAFQTLQSLPFCRRRGRNANILVTVTDVTVSLFSTVVIFVAVGAVAVNTAVLVNKCFPIWVHFDTIPFLCLQLLHPNHSCFGVQHCSVTVLWLTANLGNVASPKDTARVRYATNDAARSPL